MSVRKQDIRRLKSMLNQLDDKEVYLQGIYGDRRSGSKRSQDWHFAESLRRVIQHFEPSTAAAIGKAQGE